MSFYTKRIAIFNDFFPWYVANQETNKIVLAVLFLLNEQYAMLLNVFKQICFQTSSNYCNKKITDTLLEKMCALFCTGLC